MLQQLFQAGILDGIKGLILGEFIQKPTQAEDEQTRLLLEEWAQKLQVPVFSCPVGHAMNNFPIPFNCEVKLCFSPKTHLKFAL